MQANVGLAEIRLAVSPTPATAPSRSAAISISYEVNSALKFDREMARGFRLNIPAGKAVRFEPGDTREVPLVALAGERKVHGLNNAINGPL